MNHRFLENCRVVGFLNESKTLRTKFFMLESSFMSTASNSSHRASRRSHCLPSSLPAQCSFSSQNVGWEFVRRVVNLHQRVSRQLVTEVRELLVAKCLGPDVSNHPRSFQVHRKYLPIFNLIPACQYFPVNVPRLPRQRFIAIMMAASLSW